ncbi:MAG: outer membrane lipoprotein carrier protein LolA [Pseudomonadales bacterium]
MKGRFEQWRNLTGIPHPIRSSGRFIYWRDHGLYWETLEPISQASTFTPNTIIHWQSTPTSRQADRISSPVQKQISRILLAVFGSDIRSLEKLFDSRWNSKPEPGAKLWTVDLTPTMAAAKRVVEKITLSGENYINSLNLDASNGDTTRIHFTDIRAFAHPASDDCQYFDLDSSLCPGDKTAPPPLNRMEP